VASSRTVTTELLGTASLYDPPDLCQIFARPGSSNVIEAHGGKPKNGCASDFLLDFKTSKAS
jgi:hypothetical protein